MGLALDLGKRLRRRYVVEQPLLPADGVDAARLLEVQSTPMRRTIETAAGVLTGLLGAAGRAEAAPLRVHLHSNDVARDWMLYDATHLPALALFR